MSAPKPIASPAAFAHHMQIGGPASRKEPPRSERGPPRRNGETKGLPMAREIGTRAQIALLLYSTLNVVLFTAGVY
ncbi:MAG TPA: hypothetical protein VIK28_04425, partial [Sedimentisphaerales bacterium]